MRSIRADDHLAGEPSPAHRVVRLLPAASPPREDRAGDLTRDLVEDRAGDRRRPCAGGTTPPYDDAPDAGAPRADAPHTGAPCADAGGRRAVDDDVSGAVGRLLRTLTGERVAQAAGLDPAFGEELAGRVARFTLGGGRRIRPRFLWWALRGCGAGDGPEAEAALRLGAALELVQTCALVHDDVMDGARVRRGRPALHVDAAADLLAADPVPLGRAGTGRVSAERRERAHDFGTAVAILAGDLALAWADDLVADTVLPPAVAGRVRGIWRAMRTEMVAGQYLELRGQADASRSPDRAIRAACLKSALYSVERPLALGAALAGADEATTRALCSAGRCVGMAFQLRDDLDDLFADPDRTGKPLGGDIREGKPTYLVAVAHARAEAAGDHHALDVLDTCVGRADLSDADLARVRKAMVATGAKEAVEAKVDQLTAQGLRHLDSAALEPYAAGRLRELMRAVAGTRSGSGSGPGSGTGSVRAEGAGPARALRLADGCGVTGR
ncbi:polyprenyl synthetase family protein [Streptomyces sp. NPDC086766]|uniref:polyprenyl synthetase family protein n=1 Tax=Streptomyces sp. NPDC086766 TaxID=3365754 RepID=UPI00382460F6